VAAFAPRMPTVVVLDMPTDDLARTVSLGIVTTLVAFESIVAVHALLATRSAGRPPAQKAMWISRPVAIRTHLATRRREFDAVRWQYPTLRTARHAREVRDAIRRLGRHVDPVRRPGSPGRRHRERLVGIAA
jgi:hypothetical protein